LRASILETLESVASGELDIEDAADQIEGEMAVISTLDSYVMSAISSLSPGMNSDAELVAARAFEIAVACMRERARVIYQLGPETLDPELGDDPPSGEDDGSASTH